MGGRTRKIAYGGICKGTDQTSRDSRGRVEAEHLRWKLPMQSVRASIRQREYDAGTLPALQSFFFSFSFLAIPTLLLP